MDISTLAEGDWEVDPGNGLLYWLNGTGMATPWKFCTGLVVAYSGGWVMPGEEGRTLPPAIEAAAVAYCRSLLASRDRDPMLRSVEIPGVISRDYYSPQPRRRRERAAAARRRLDAGTVQEAAV